MTATVTQHHGQEDQTMARAAPAAAPEVVFKPKMYDLQVGFTKESLEKMLTTAVDLGCSDIKIQSGDYVNVYYKRQWFPLNNRALEESEATKCLSLLVNPAAVSKVGGGRAVDYDPEYFRHDKKRSRIRMRLNARASRVGRCANGVTITLRTIPEELPELKNLGLPQALIDEIMPKKGLVLMSGQTGSGKTTTIAGCLHERSKEDPAPCIQTFEEPAEFAYDMTGLGRGPLVAQCDIGQHLSDWSMAGRNAMRSKADIILMGEVRDPQTAEATSEMAITGHMVFGTIHADTPNETVFRIIEFFPPEMRSAAASKFLSSLRVLVSQKLIRVVDKEGQVRVIPLHSWLSFDSDMKEDLQSPEWPYPRWAAYVKQKLKEKGQDFASRCIPLIKDGLISADDLKEIALMGTEEAKAFFNKHSAPGATGA